jgi:hypothetical protein
MANKFDRKKAVEYAREWADSRNPAFPDYSASQGGGGDCANFVSQSLLAGGWHTLWGAEVDPCVWWVTSERQSSWSWRAAARLQGYLDISGRASRCAQEKLDLADVVFQKIDGKIVHAMLVTGIERSRGQQQGSTDFLLSYHSREALDRPLSEILKLYDPKRCTYEYWKVADLIPEGRRSMMGSGPPPGLYRTFPART